MVELRAVTVRCPAKINLGLWVLGRRPDGFHEIDTILQAVTVEDSLRLTRSPSGFQLTLLGRPIARQGANMVERAYRLLVDRGILPAGTGVTAALAKRIPVGGGLGGGSSDAVGFLVGVNRLFGLGLDPERLTELATCLGSDCAFFVRGGTARATGRGDRVEQIGPMRAAWIVLADPGFGIASGWAYGLLKNQLTATGSEASILASAIAAGDLDAIADALSNRFEDVVLPQFPSLALVKRAFVAGGAAGSLLSGSGSALFGLARSRVHALTIAGSVARVVAHVEVVRTLDRGVETSPLE